MSKYFVNPPTEADLLSVLVDSNDPKSINYVRKLSYHKINWIKCLIHTFVFLGIIAISIFSIWFIFENIIIVSIMTTAFAVVYCLIMMKSILIFFISIYQRIAPKKLRCRCRFEPSCSEYTIKVIEKYGAYKGMIKGIKRINRCKYPYGGIDEP